jgi:hypothetical protein
MLVVIAVMLTGIDEVLLMVKVLAALSTPIVPPVKLRDVGVVVIATALVPVRPTNASRLLPLS